MSTHDSSSWAATVGKKLREVEHSLEPLLAELIIQGKISENRRREILNKLGEAIWDVELRTVEQMQQPGPDDVVVLRTSKPLPTAAIVRLESMLRDTFPNAGRFVVLDPGYSVEVRREAQRG